MSVLSFDQGSSHYELLQSSSLDEGFYLLLQVEGLVGIVTMVPMKMTILIPVSPLWWGSDRLRLLDARVIFSMHEYLLH